MISIPYMWIQVWFAQPRKREIKWEIWRKMEEWGRNACRRLPRPESYTYFQIRFLKKLIHVEVTAQQWKRPSPHIVFEETWKHHLKARINLARDIAHKIPTIYVHTRWNGTLFSKGFGERKNVCTRICHRQNTVAHGDSGKFRPKIISHPNYGEFRLRIDLQLINVAPSWTWITERH